MKEMITYCAGIFMFIVIIGGALTIFSEPPKSKRELLTMIIMNFTPIGWLIHISKGLKITFEDGYTYWKNLED